MKDIQKNKEKLNCDEKHFDQDQRLLTVNNWPEPSLLPINSGPGHRTHMTDPGLRAHSQLHCTMMYTLQW